MSAFTHKVTATLDAIPGEPGATATIRKLAPRHLEAAAKEAQRQSIAEVKAIGVDLINELGKLKKSDITAAVNADPLLTYDVPTLIDKGVIEWTLSEPFTPENVRDLDDDAQQYFGRAILKLAKPKLFQTADEREADTKNG